MSTTTDQRDALAKALKQALSILTILLAPNQAHRKFAEEEAKKFIEDWKVK